MAADRPLIAVLLAVYEPRLDWLREQLCSIDAQTWPNLRVYIRDDASARVPFEQIAACAAACLRRVPYELRRNAENLGSNQSFALLTAEAEGEAFAYCDQDDVWLPEKLAVLYESMVRERAQLVCSDMLVIDGEGRQLAESITKHNKRQRFSSGEGLQTLFLSTNFVTGTAMLIRADTAREALPFPPRLLHDRYLALCAARKGRIVSLPDRLLRYRVHGGNQTELMKGVSDKASYREQRILEPLEELDWLSGRFGGDPTLAPALADKRRWLEARDGWFTAANAADARALWRGRRWGLPVTLFELAMAHMPEGVFRACIRLRKANRI